MKEAVVGGLIRRHPAGQPAKAYMFCGSKGEELLAEYKRALEVMSAKKAAPKKAALCENDDEVKFIKSNKSDESRQV
ncbi:hypothetical protein YC2023_010967 [Brassica napus]